MKWITEEFNDFIKLNRGFDLPNDKIKEGPYPVVASTEIKAHHDTFKVKAPGVVTGRSGSLGTVQYVKKDFWPLNTSLYVKDFKGNNPSFVYYYLKTMHLELYNSGAGVPTLNQNHLHHIKVVVPEAAADQKRIASILSHYDDLIEINKRRIALLEESARELYKEWFVRMRFPNYEKVHFVEGKPEDWDLVNLTDIIEIRYGKDHKALEDGNIPCYGSGGIMRYVESQLYNGECVLIPRKGTLNNIMWVNGPFWTIDTMFYGIPMKEHVAKLVFFYLSSLNMEMFNAGAALPSMTTKIPKVSHPQKASLK